MSSDEIDETEIYMQGQESVTYNFTPGIYRLHIFANENCGTDQFERNIAAICNICETEPEPEPETQYCTPSAFNNDATGITRVLFNTIDNASGSDEAYQDFTGIATLLVPGNSYPLTVNVNTEGNYMVYVYAWIDWNQDLTFDTETEEYNLGSALNVSNGTTSLSPLNIQVPTGVAAGNYRMRIRAVYYYSGNMYAEYPQPCGSRDYSEAEDYTLTVDGQATFDCPDLQANHGDPCNDGNTDTVNDVITANCGCEGTPVAPLDTDNDGVADDDDNCSETPNPNQEDLDNDGIGDACDDDIDGDGVANADDCDPYDPEVTTGPTWFADADGDGFGNAAVSVTSCTQPAGFVADNTDCNDNDATVYPGATETANDGIDQDCNGEDLVEEEDCTAPTGVLLTRLSPTTAELTTDNSTQLYQGSANRAGRPLRPYPMYGMNSISSGHIQSGLVTAFDYDVWLRTICSDGTFTERAGPFYLPTIESMAKVSNVKLTPNPAVQWVKVEGMKVKEMRIFDKFGRLVISTAMQSNEFDVRKLQSGIYTVQLIGENGEISVQQLIKK